MRSGDRNPNWKGGITAFRKADELLSLPQFVQDDVTTRILNKIAADADSGCWVWIGSVFKSNGRAKLVLGKNHLAYRLTYVLFKGPTGDLNVLHTCDNVLCVNPDHLFLGSCADNSADMVRKGRSLDQSGSLNHMAVLNEHKVKEIKLKLSIGSLTQRQIALEYGVCFQAINNISRGKTWKHV